MTDEELERLNKFINSEVELAVKAERERIYKELVEKLSGQKYGDPELKEDEVLFLKKICKQDMYDK